MKDQSARGALAAFERRITLRLYATGVAVVLAEAALRRFWR